MKLLDANLQIIKDSRGNDTLEAELKSEKFSGSASVPSGKSRGKHEAFVLEPKKALGKFEEIKPQILGREFDSQEEFDIFLISLDATPDKQNLGANLILALSLAFARLKARSEGKELFQHITDLYGLHTDPHRNSLYKSVSGQRKSVPMPIFNVINGGSHSTSPQGRLDFQEFQIIPEVKDFGIALGLGQEFYKNLKEFLEKKFGKEMFSLGDEAGFCAPFKNNEEAIEILAELIAKYNYPLRIGLDMAATQFYKENSYFVSGKSYSAEELKEFYLKLIENYNIFSIEDPFHEEAFDDFSALSREITTKDIMVITDDLTVTNSERLKIAIEKKSGNTILIKPNQIGTLTETIKVIKLAYENNWQTVISHRSGETMDDFIADLAVGINAWGLKAGAPAAPERMAKYERVLKIFTFALS